VQLKKNSGTQFLHLIENDQESPLSSPVKEDLSLEADQIEALNGVNPYSTFLRKHGHRPDRTQASTIGRLMGARVRASDGTMQPKLSAGERAAIKSIKKRRKEWGQQVEHIRRTMAAIAALSENQHDPSTVIDYAADVFLDSAIHEQLEIALNWLNRFAEESRRHEQGSRAKGPKLVGINHRQVAERWPDD